MEWAPALETGVGTPRCLKQPLPTGDSRSSVSAKGARTASLRSPESTAAGGSRSPKASWLLGLGKGLESEHSERKPGPAENPGA